VKRRAGSTILVRRSHIRAGRRTAQDPAFKKRREDGTARGRVGSAQACRLSLGEREAGHFAVLVLDSLNEGGRFGRQSRVRSGRGLERVDDHTDVQRKPHSNASTR
jgi:hypothetical protein